jgi:hypothetical protein
MKRATLILILIALFLLAGSALAMSSQNFGLDWFTPMTGGGGGPASSANYAANLTVGQTVIGASASEHFGAGLGYWYGFLSSMIQNFLDFLPLVQRNAP